MRRWSLVFALSLLLLAVALHAPASQVVQDTARAADSVSSPAGKHAAAVAPPAVQAGVTMNLSPAAANNFTIGMTGFSVSFVPSPNVYRVYGTGGYHHLRWNVNNNFIFTKYHRTVNWPDFGLAFNGIGDCAHSEDPLSFDRKCATEAVGYFWKRVACPSPDPGNVACQNNERWNAAPGTYNITPTPTPGIWPNSFGQGYGTPGYTPVIDIESVNSVQLKPAEACATPYGHTVWVNDTTPLDAAPGGNEGWTWVAGGPAPFHGQYSHQSANAAGIHQHFFTNASNKLDVEVGDRLIAYVYLDPAAPPSQVMLQWNDGTWEHRAYWGENLLPWGANGQASRYPMGALPDTGQWVRLEVPASLVGLEGRTLNGMAFTLYGGRAVWDRAGKITAINPQSTNLAVGKPVAQSNTFTAALPSGPAALAVDGNTNGDWFSGSVAGTNYGTQSLWQVDLGVVRSLDQIRVWNRTDCCPERLSNFYVFVSDQPFAWNDAYSTQYQPGVSTYYVAGQGATPSVVFVGRSGRYVRVQLAATNYLSLAEVEVFGR